MFITAREPFEPIFEKHYSLLCPHCQVLTNITAISFPNFNLIMKYGLKSVGIVYKCDNCKHPIFLEHNCDIEYGNSRVQIYEQYESVQYSIVKYELEYLPEEIRKEFVEALKCYSFECYNAFAAMCRRTIQTSCTTLGVEGNDKVMKQINNMKDFVDIENEQVELLKQIVINGHDGSHPHLPEITKERADLLLEFMKDALYELFVRKMKLNKAIQLRKSEITKKNEKA